MLQHPPPLVVDGHYKAAEPELELHVPSMQKSFTKTVSENLACTCMNVIAIRVNGVCNLTIYVHVSLYENLKVVLVSEGG